MPCQCHSLSYHIICYIISCSTSLDVIACYIISYHIVVDIKPYHPNDIAPSPRIPSWMMERPIATLTVQFCYDAIHELQQVVSELQFYHDFDVSYGMGRGCHVL